MRYDALATDYDGTLADNGSVAGRTVAALERARAAGLRLILVTGRELADLHGVFPQLALFDRVVAENGAVLADPRAGSARVLAPAPPAALLEDLTRKAVPFTVGRTIVATARPYDAALVASIRDLGLDWHVILNKASVMALPRGVTKASGLRAALEELGVTPGTTVGVGDAENDLAFLRECGLAVAVANALAPVKAEAGLVTAGGAGAGVAELIRRIGSESQPP